MAANDPLQLPDPSAPMMESSLSPPPAPGGAAQSSNAPSLQDYIHQHLQALPVNTSDGKRKYKKDFIHSYIQNASTNWASLYGEQLKRQAPPTPVQSAQARYQNALAAGQEAQNDTDPSETQMTPYQVKQTEHWAAQDAVPTQGAGGAPGVHGAPPAELPEPIDQGAAEDDIQGKVSADTKAFMGSPQWKLIGKTARKPGRLGGLAGDRAAEEDDPEALKAQQDALTTHSLEREVYHRKTALEHGPEGQIVSQLEQTISKTSPAKAAMIPQALDAIAATVKSDPRMSRYFRALARLKERQMAQGSAK